MTFWCYKATFRAWSIIYIIYHWYGTAEGKSKSCLNGDHLLSITHPIFCLCVVARTIVEAIYSTSTFTLHFVMLCSEIINNNKVAIYMLMFGLISLFLFFLLCPLAWSFLLLPSNSKPWKTIWPTLWRGIVNWRTKWPNWSRSANRLRYAICFYVFMLLGESEIYTVMLNSPFIYIGRLPCLLAIIIIVRGQGQIQDDSLGATTDS